MKQNYDLYTAADFETWKILSDRQIPVLEKTAYSGYLNGIELLGLRDGKIPSFYRMNQILGSLNGWEIVVVSGLVEAKNFFELLRQKKFCASTWLRQRSQLDYLEEPDMFHDVFGHIPGLTDPFITGFLEALATLTLSYMDNAQAVELLSRIYWFTIEFGMVKNEEHQVKVLGAGLLSSAGEVLHCLSPEAVHVPFDVPTILDTTFRKDTYQPAYFVLESPRQLQDSIPELQSELAKRFSLSRSSPEDK